MATHDYVISNGTGAAVRADLNLALAAIVSNNSSSSEPATKYAYMWWADTNTGILKIRNSANNGWVELLQLDGTLTLEDGSETQPALAFRDDLDTGIFSEAANEFNITTAGGKRLSIDGSGRVGIAADPVTDKLEVGGAIRSVSGSANFSAGPQSAVLDFDTSGNVARVGSITGASGSARPLVFVIGGVEKSRFSSTGQFLIGDTNNPSGVALVVDGGNIKHRIDAGEIGRIFFLAGTGGYNLSVTGGAAVCSTAVSEAGGVSQDLFFEIHKQGEAHKEAMRITRQGHVCIGTSTPDSFNGAGANHQLVVRGSSNNTDVQSNFNASITISNGDGTAGNTAGIHFAREDNDGIPHYIGASVVGQFINAQVDGQYPLARMVFLVARAQGAAPTRCMELNNNADLLLSDGSTMRNQITSSHSDLAAAINRAGFHMTDGPAIIHATGSGNRGFELFTSNQGQAGSSMAKKHFSVDHVGNVTITNNSYGQISDEKLKQDIVDSGSQWDDVKAVKVKKFKFKDAVSNLGADKAILQIGVVAQDLEAAGMNGLVYEMPDIIDNVDQGTVTKNVKYSVLYMKAIKALQEAMTRIETLETKVAALESA